MAPIIEIDEEAWRPLKIQERLDAYYSFREARADDLMPLPPTFDPFAHRQLSFIAAEELGELPETAHMTIKAASVCDPLTAAKPVTSSPAPSSAAPVTADHW